MKTWLRKQRGGFFLKSEAKAVGPGRNYWLGFMMPNGDVDCIKITSEIYTIIKRGRREK
jgi:hypothetical protein